MAELEYALVQTDTGELVYLSGQQPVTRSVAVEQLRMMNKEHAAGTWHTLTFHMGIPHDFALVRVHARQLAFDVPL